MKNYKQLVVVMKGIIDLIQRMTTLIGYLIPGDHS